MATTRIRIGPADHGRRMTLDEFIDAEGEPGYLYELARGVIESVDVPADSHAQIVHNVHEGFSTYRRQHPGLILRLGHGSEIELIIPALESERYPDLAIILRGTPPDERGHRPPALVVEVASPGAAARRRDYEAKREEYLTLGIREYWIVDPRLRQVTVLLRRDGEAGPAWEERTFRGEEVIVGDLLPGYAGTVADLWADVEADDEGREAAP